MTAIQSLTVGTWTTFSTKKWTTVQSDRGSFSHRTDINGPRSDSSDRFQHYRLYQSYFIYRVLNMFNKIEKIK